MQTDYLLVGQGIAGTVLGHTLLQKGSSVIVVSDEDPSHKGKTYSSKLGQR